MVPFSGKNDGYFIQLPPSIRRALYRDYMHFGKSAKNFAFALIVSQHTFISKDEKKRVEPWLMPRLHSFLHSFKAKLILVLVTPLLTGVLPKRFQCHPE
jgi:hypothetical protein